MYLHEGYKGYAKEKPGLYLHNCPGWVILFSYHPRLQQYLSYELPWEHVCMFEFAAIKAVHTMALYGKGMLMISSGVGSFLSPPENDSSDAQQLGAAVVFLVFCPQRAT